MEYFKIGKIATTHGVDGKVIIRHSLGRKCDFKSINALFTEENRNSFLPWFIINANTINDKETIVSLEGIANREEARKFLQKEIWLTEDDFKKLASTTAPISWLGFQVVENNQPLGIIAEIIEQPHQVLCKIILENKEVWIPLHQESLKKIDVRNKQVVVVLPDGLLDVYIDS